MFFAIMPVLLFMLAVSVDSLSAGFSYGASRVRIQPLSAVFLVFIPAVSITLMTKIGTLLFSFIPAHVFTVLSFLLLFFLACEKLLESLIRHLAEKYPHNVGNWAYKIKQVNIIFTIYFSPEDANKQDVQVLNAKEALLLSLALSLDSILASMAFSCQVPSLLFFFLLAVLFHFLLFAAGYLLGLFISGKFSFDLSWLSGLFLLLLALCTLL
ncbi:MAG: hypothetical protein NC314_11925 [Roseburia sp.]|nr:hypothetical protein [Ruminococcus sp.]MCM1155119.1 hypothetical protein [Roseburia sp.]MCM1243540.1 hypothetical protein [Roseburia sp.]